MKIIKKAILLILFSGCIIILNAQNSVITEKLNDHLYKICIPYGESSANVVASIGDDGILIVDAAYSRTANVLDSILNSLSAKELRYVVNTHLHPDHVGGNALFGTKATIIGHKNTRKLLTTGDNILYRYPEHRLPKIEISDTTSLYFNNEKINLIPLTGGHTKSDIIVHFTNSNIVCLGDIVIDNCFPYIDSKTGGYHKTLISNLETVISSFSNDISFIPGHGNTLSYNQIINYQKMAIETSDIVCKEFLNGTTALNQKEKDILKEYDSWGNSYVSKNTWIEMLETDFESKGKIKKSVIEELFLTLNQSSIDECIIKYRILKNNSFKEYNFSEQSLNTFGYYLVQKNRIKDAIKILKLNTEEYPESANVFDSYAEALMINGQKDAAIKNYKKSLELNPNNNNASKILQELQN